MSLRMDKVNKEIFRQLTRIIQEEVDDPCLSFLSITRVETTRDLRECKVFFSLLNEEHLPRAVEALKKMNKFLRGSLGRALYIKITPQLHFIPDESIKYSVDINTKIDQIINEESR
ncbi:MAG: 30S ribosome-binding factor RbfA [Candidatus Omnitrophica bacterium]|nr:30S ribosome-binding factor RbfA [Candidatus Omnitrophota bacterium]